MEKRNDGFFDKNLEIIETTCETFTRLLLSLTPFKAKEFVEKNCKLVTDKIVENVKSTILNRVLNRVLNKVLNEGGESNE